VDRSWLHVAREKETETRAAFLELSALPKNNGSVVFHFENLAKIARGQYKTSPGSSSRVSSASRSICRSKLQLKTRQIGQQFRPLRLCSRGTA
jgi:hypothetical protein